MPAGFWRVGAAVFGFDKLQLNFAAHWSSTGGHDRAALGDRMRERCPVDTLRPIKVSSTILPHNVLVGRSDLCGCRVGETAFRTGLPQELHAKAPCATSVNFTDPAVPVPASFTASVMAVLCRPS